MKNARLAAALALVLAVGAPVRAGLFPDHWDGNYLMFLDQPKDRQPDELKILFASKVPSKDAAVSVALDKWGLRIRAYQTFYVIGLYRLATDDADMATSAQVHWVWEVAFDVGLAFQGIIFVDAETKKAQIVFAGRTAP